MNILTAVELKRRGMAAIEEGLRQGPLHLIKRNQPTAVVLSEEDYQRLVQGRPAAQPTVTALQWLLSQSAPGNRGKAEIDAALQLERNSWTDA